MKEKKFIKLTPFKMQVLQSFPFIDEDFDAITNYELLCKVVEYLNKTVYNVDLLNEKVEEFQNYFDNLDVQEEINNKLDEMAESGQLTDIIAEYLGLAGVLSFNNVNDMKQATNLVDGSICQTLGYYSVNDGGSAKYKIRTINNTDVVDEMTIIAIGSNNLVAELIIPVPLSVKCLGAKGDNLNDDTNSIKTALNISNNILLPRGTYKTTSSIILNNKSNIIIDGNNSQLNIDGLLKGINFINSNNITIKNLNIKSLLQYNALPINHNRDIFIEFENCNNINIDNCVFEYGSMGIVFMSCENIKFTNNLMHDFKGWGCIFGASVTKCYKAIIKNNISYNSSYDGIKLTGYIKDIIIQNNICYDNNSDGIDFAGHTAKNIIICNNDLHDNKLNGIDFKQLERDTYPYNDDFIKEFENINIHDNLISSNLTHSINSQLYYNDVNVNNFNIYNNTIKMDNLSTHNSSTGIRIAPGNILNKGDIKIYNNNVDSKAKNLSCIRLSNTKNIEIYNNKLLNGLTASIYIDDQNIITETYDVSSSDIYIDSNELTVSGDVNSNVIRFTNLNNPENIQITNNKMQNTRQSAYAITPTTFGNGFVFNGNSEINKYNEIPTGRSFKNMIYYAEDPSVTNCIGWIATNTTSPATYKKYIDLS